MEPEHTDSDEKSLMFARINHELAEREVLEQQRQELLRRKQVLIAENKKRKDDLASLDKDLETFIDVHAHPRGFQTFLLITARLLNRFKRFSKSNTKPPRKIGSISLV